MRVRRKILLAAGILFSVAGLVLGAVRFWPRTTAQSATARRVENQEDETKKLARKLVCDRYQQELNKRGVRVVIFLGSDSTDMIVVAPLVRDLAEGVFTPGAMAELREVGFNRITMETAPGTWVGEIRVGEGRWVWR